jgi:hypothetical protein
VQLKSLLQRGGTIDWSSDSGYEAFNTMFKPDQSHANDHFSLRDAQMSSELSQVAVKLAAGRDIFYLGSLVNRAIREGFHKMAGAVLEDHKQEVDEEGNTLLMCACLNSWDCLVKHLVYMPGVDIEARNKAGKNAIELAVERVPPPLTFPVWLRMLSVLCAFCPSASVRYAATVISRCGFRNLRNGHARPFRQVWAVIKEQWAHPGMLSWARYIPIVCMVAK